MKNVALTPLNTIVELKKAMLSELRAKHNVTHILLGVLICIAFAALVAFVVMKVVQKMDADEYDLYDDFDDLDDLDFDEHDVLADDGDFVK